MFLEADKGPSSAAPAAPEATGPLTLPQKLSAAIASKAALQQENARLLAEAGEASAEIERLSTELTRVQGELTGAQTKITDLEGQLAAKNGEIERLKVAEPGKVAAAASETVAEVLGKSGVKAETLPAPQGEDQNDDAVYDRWSAAAGTEKQAIYTKHKGVIRAVAKRRGA